MNKVYHVKEYTKESVKRALKKALDIVAGSNGEIKTIMLLFPTLTVAEKVLEGILPKESIHNRRAHNNNQACGILIETIKTYSIQNKHILVPILLTEKEMMSFEDERNACEWVVVPQNFEALEPWFKVHASVDVDTTNSLLKNGDFPLDERVVNGIEWLWATSYPNEGFNHPLDLNRLKSMANALAAKGIDVEYYSVLYYCITHKINHEGGRMISDYFVKAKSRKFKTDGNYNLSFMTEMMNTKHPRI